MIEDKVYYCKLYDCYSKLFNNNQQNYFLEYFHEDLSLAEIALKYNVSRAAISKQLKVVKNQLEEYENNLHLAKLYFDIDKLIVEIDELDKEEIKTCLINLGG